VLPKDCHFPAAQQTMEDSSMRSTARGASQPSAAIATDAAGQSASASTAPPPAAHPAASAPTSEAAAAGNESAICSFYLERKKRICARPVAMTKQTAVMPSRFCAHHSSVAQSGSNDGSKLPCPLCGALIRAEHKPHALENGPARNSDAAASCSSSAFSSSNSLNEHTAVVVAARLTPLQLHLAVCPRRRVESAEAQLPFYEKACNGVWHMDAANTAASFAPAAGIDAAADAHAPVSSAVSSLSDVPRAQLADLIARLRAIALSLNISHGLMNLQPEDAEQSSGTAAPANTAAMDVDQAQLAAAAIAAGANASPAAVLSRRSRARHQLQHASFFALLRRRGLLRELGGLLLEVGAGKAGLVGFIAGQYPRQPGSTIIETQQLQRAHNEQAQAATHGSAAPVAAAPAESAQPPYRLLVLDRGSFKHKSDPAIRRDSRCTLARYRCDLADVRFERMQEVQDVVRQRVAAATSVPPVATAATSSGTLASRSDAAPLTLVVGKHVCGQATDFVIRAVVRANNPPLESSEMTLSRPPLRLLINGVAIATCCHHLCSWESYCNRPFLESFGISRHDFAVMARMSTWFLDNSCASSATALAVPASATGAAASQVSDLSTDGAALSSAERAWLGFVCKHLLDEGRARCLADEAHLRGALGSPAQRVPYSSAEVTKERWLLLAA
jgi:hypothetical protein